MLTLQFQNLCLDNAEAAMASAEQLKNTGANHIAYHLCTLALDEVGKIYIGWMNFNRSQKAEEQHGQIVLDDQYHQSVGIITITIQPNFEAHW